MFKLLKNKQYRLFMYKYGFEILAVIAITLFTTAKIAHVAQSAWKEILLYNADSLTLPVLRQSLAHKEVAHWILSSQIFIFPEGVVYAICSFFVSSVRGSLVLNSYVNILLLYGLFRFIAGVSLPKRKLSQIAFALFATSSFLIFTLLERNTLVNVTAIATPYLLNTYYYGVIIAGLFSVGMSLLIIRAPLTSLRITRQQKGLIATFLSMVIVIGLTQFTDPLFALQFTLPFVVTITLLYWTGRINFVKTFYLFMSQVLGLALAQVLHSTFKSLFSGTTGDYMQYKKIPESLYNLRLVIKTAGADKATTVEFLLILLFILIPLILVFCFVYKKSRGQNFSAITNDAQLFLITFASIAPASMLFGFIVTGNTVTRYLLPLLIFPFVGFLPLFNISNLVKKGLFIVTALVVASGVIMGLNGARDVPSLTKPSEDYSLCLQKALNGKAANGVGGYWISRAVDVYGRPDQRVLQVNGDLTILPWLSNADSYKNKDFSFILISNKNPNDTVTAPWVNEHVGAPKSVDVCPTYDVYQYAPESAEYKTLNKIIDKSEIEYNRTHKF